MITLPLAMLVAMTIFEYRLFYSKRYASVLKTEVRSRPCRQVTTLLRRSRVCVPVEFFLRIIVAEVLHVKKPR